MTSELLERTAVRSATAVFTGIGVTAPNGLGTQAWWEATVAGESGIRPVSRFDASGYPATLAGEVPGFEAEEHIPSRLLPQTDHMTRLALTAAKEALEDSGADPAEMPQYSAGAVTAASAGGFEFGQRELQALWSKGGQYVSAYQSYAWFYAVNTGQISIRHGLRGPSGVLVTEQAGGLDAVAQARRQLRKGSKLIVTGGVDGAVCPWGWTAQLAGGRMSSVADPARAFLPFDSEASGYVAGEGGAILVLEDAEAARERGARIYGQLSGYAATFDPGPGREGEPGLRRAAELALAEAGLSTGDVDVVFADASGVPELDRQEEAALTALFGPRGVPVTAPKTMTGRLSAGGASLDLAAALLSIRDAVIPPTVNVTSPVAADALDLVTEARRGPVRTALVLARGTGGFNAAAVVTAAN
ncbi:MULTISPECIES: ketosynthase chain-length factor [Streptomyces]|uniref:Actinorhodin polyketide putative beta-ketoacyl synthase 2 n=1 Tax=Streptomyces xanthochromogenes TaxID=67384 RepID=A0ABQ2ZUX4_9ACTN|nr:MULTISPECIES: ketosynthase chain-length factor [Streptomyces]GGY23440.1 actinorhodin polyketide putative beta-ketoacyl synthase 2 [Streptomyces xanthochromogenes]GHB70524.1 actinorhodin polyketide putative beta-ketoacyl synthase 2 [Streptomyces xanthochromogenes]